tara:strand:- start:2872 stop:3372 length:501 start_codon:yes stop_codon:yes gene_type:complete
MFLKLFDDTATMKLVNIGLAQSIEKYEPEKELSKKEIEERKSFPEFLKKGIRVIWNDQIQMENSENENCFYSEQIFYGITFEQLKEVLNSHNLYIRPIGKEDLKKVEDTPAPAEAPDEAPDEAPVVAMNAEADIVTEMYDTIESEQAKSKVPAKAKKKAKPKTTGK